MQPSVKALSSIPSTTYTQKKIMPICIPPRILPNELC